MLKKAKMTFNNRRIFKRTTIPSTVDEFIVANVIYSSDIILSGILTKFSDIPVLSKIRENVANIRFDVGPARDMAVYLYLFFAAQDGS